MIWGNTENVDLYINYNCDLRCNHCFVGDMLKSKIEMPLETVKAIINSCSDKGIKTITLLGGEPCLHSEILQIVKYIDLKKIKLRIVTNGQKSYLKFINLIENSLREKIHICFSIDGSRQEIHDTIRGANSYNKLIESINQSLKFKISISGILSVSTDNIHDVHNVIKLCKYFKMKYLNIHYVTNRGFALEEKIVDIIQWAELCRKIKKDENGIKIRIEETFVPLENKISCGVTEKQNIIIDPYGKVFGCTMFLDFQGYQTANFENGEWKANNKILNENYVCKKDCDSCPGIELINNKLHNEARTLNYKIDCIFKKSTLN